MWVSHQILQRWFRASKPRKPQRGAGKDTSSKGALRSPTAGLFEAFYLTLFTGRRRFDANWLTFLNT